MAVTLPAQPLRVLRGILNDALYRGSLYLLVNNVATSAIGFVFWTLAAHRYSASTVGVFSSVTSGASLLAAVAALGLPITMTRHIASAERPRELVFMAVTVIATLGTALCLATVVFLGPHLPAALHVREQGGMALLVTLLVVFAALGTTLDAGLVAVRASRMVLLKNLAGSIVKLAAMLVLASTLRSSGLLVSFGAGLVLATTVSGIALGHRLRTEGKGFAPLRAPWHYLSATSGNYLATVIGILPLSMVPIEVLAIRGASQTASFAIAFMIAGFLNFIPSTTGQVLFAEVARGGVPLGKQLRKALYAVYGLLLPATALIVAAAPLVLRLFGHAYAAQATGCLRVLALSALPGGGTYLISSLLIARDRLAAYIFLQTANAALVLGFVGALLPRGLTAGACGLAIAQMLTLVICLLLLATGRAGRHHTSGAAAALGAAGELHPVATPALTAEQTPSVASSPQCAQYDYDPQVQDLLASRPTMPTVAELEPGPLRQSTQASWTRYMAGENAQIGLWFPPVKIPVGSGQVRSARQLPVLLMITGYSCWMSAVLIPSSRAGDLFAGWWNLITGLGAVPRVFTAPGAMAIGRWENGQSQTTGECAAFCRSLNASVILSQPGDPATTGLARWAQAHLEKFFLDGRTFRSPRDFNIQLGDWLAVANAQERKPPGCSPTMLISEDRRAMHPLPSIPPVTGWRRSAPLTGGPFIDFDYNRYRIHPDLLGRRVEIQADLHRVRVLHERKIAAEYDRAWTYGQLIS